jgi:glycosyltransferase involved in cell wall biosynthesis
MISVFIPVYKESDFLDILLYKLVKDRYQEKEIFVVIDEPTKKSLDIGKKYGKQCNFIFNKERLGKSNFKE